MPTRISVAYQNADADLLSTLLGAGTGPGEVEIRTGSQPATPATTATGTLLGTVVLEDPAFSAATAGVAEIVPPDPVNWVADGTAGWCRFMDSDGVAVVDGEVTTTAGSGLLRLSNLTAVTSEPIEITGGTWAKSME